MTIESVAQGIATIVAGRNMYNNLCELAHVIENAGEIARVELDFRMSFPIATLLEYMQAFGMIRTENRKEETIEITTHELFWTHPTDSTLAIPCFAYGKNPFTGTTVKVDVPRPKGWCSQAIEIQKKIQVTRKYIIWVG